jgi:glycosyltransferase involved in cell wall biosynthesis
LYGAEQSLLHVVRRLDPKAWEPEFVLPGDGPFAGAIRMENWPVRWFDVKRGPGSAFGLARTIREARPDLVHLNLHFDWATVSLAGLLAGVPLVIHVRNMIDGRPGGVLRRRLFRRAAATICISEAVRDRLRDSGLADAAAMKRVALIPDGRDFTRSVPGDRARFRAEIGVDPETPLIGMVARIEWMKGQDIFLDAARAVVARVPRARFVLVGDVMSEASRPYLAELERAAAEPPLAGRVSFLGYRRDIADVLAGLDCFVHSSRRGAFVSVLIEAMAAGVPVVASDVDGIPECVGREGEGILVTPLEPGPFADAITAVVSDPSRAGLMASTARSRVRERFDVAPLARETEAVFRRVLQQASV